MADRAQLSEAIDQAIRALQELKRVWEEQEEAAPQAAAPAPAPKAVPEYRAQTGERTCPVCGSAVGSSSKFCKECGASLPAAAPAAPVFHAAAAQSSAPAANAAPARSAFCMKCGNPLQPGDRFCMKCGAPAK